VFIGCNFGTEGDGGDGTELLRAEDLASTIEVAPSLQRSSVFYF